MPGENETTRISKFLSLVLRHKPEAIGLHLNENGWADVEELINKMNKHNIRITRDILNSRPLKTLWLITGQGFYQPFVRK